MTQLTIKNLLPTASIGLSVVALAVALLSTWSSDPLAAYDFSSPENALRSLAQLNAEMDMDAIAFCKAREIHQGSVEKLQSLRVSRVVEYGGCKGLFFSYTRQGVVQCEVDWFEKNADTGHWVNDIWFQSKINDNSLNAEIYEWLAKGSDENGLNALFAKDFRKAAEKQ
jgi:hypothetical protein